MKIKSYICKIFFMSGKFSFNNSDISTLLTKAHQLIPGIGKIISIQYAHQKQKIEAHTLSQPSNPNTIQEIHLEEKVLETINEFRIQDMNFNWFSSEDLPFHVDTQKIVQMDVFRELERNILLISFPNEFDKKNDLMFFYFNENISNFIISNSGKSLTPENKVIIGTLLSNSLHTLLDVLRHDRKTLSNYNSNVKHVIHAMKEAQNAISEFKDKHDLVLLNYSNELLNQMRTGSGFKFVLAESAIIKIKEYTGEISTLKTVITNAASFAGNLNMDSNDNSILIEDYHLNFDVAKRQEAAQPLVQENGRYAKTISLLDRLEAAAQDVYRNKKALTGSNVGSAFKPEISAPAISDALKKHRMKIITLVKDYPDRWNLIRTEFKPLINIITPRYNAFDKQA